VADIKKEGFEYEKTFKCEKKNESKLFTEHLILCNEFAKKIQRVHAFGRRIERGLVFSVKKEIGGGNSTPNGAKVLFGETLAVIDGYKYEYHEASEILVMKIMMTKTSLSF
ncbi:MAG: hypothetical protein ACPGTS_02360, partial [Minisyncoccia bacterium]